MHAESMMCLVCSQSATAPGMANSLVYEYAAATICHSDVFNRIRVSVSC